MHNSPLARLELFPITTKITKSGGASSLSIAALSIAGCNLAALAEQYGTPLYLYDRQTLDHCVIEYKQALQEFYPGESGITYAGKAFLCTALVQWTQRHGLWLDCSSNVEMAIARAAKAPKQHILLHGVNKSFLDLQGGMQSAGVIVLDHLDELNQLIHLSEAAGMTLPNLWLRLRPGLSADTHAYIQTGQADSKFGMDIEEALELVSLCFEHGLPLIGLHFHLGSLLHNPAQLTAALDVALDFIQQAVARMSWMPQVLCPGGGWGVAYHEEDLPQPHISDYVKPVATHLVEGCQRRGIPLPRLQVEPGRSLAARAGVALYRVGAVKTTPNRRWILMDGGMADNPRPALYEARYSALPVKEPGRIPSGPAWVGGKYCESGDILIQGLPLPDMAPGELLAVPASGAYQLSMSSNYNGALKPAVLWLEEGQAHLIQKREEAQDLTSRDLPLPEI